MVVVNGSNTAADTVVSALIKKRHVLSGLVTDDVLRVAQDDAVADEEEGVPRRTLPCGLEEAAEVPGPWVSKKEIRVSKFLANSCVSLTTAS